MTDNGRSEAKIARWLRSRNGHPPSKVATGFMAGLDFMPPIRANKSLYPNLRRALAEYLELHCEIDIVSRRDVRLTGQAAWSATFIASEQRKFVANSLQRLLSSLDAEFARSDSLVDLGCGDGIAVCRLLEAIEPFCSVENILLVDQSEAATKHATLSVRDCVARDLNIRPLHRDIRDDFIWENSQNMRPIVFASGALHELTRAEKTKVLAKIKEYSRYFILVELLADHDSEQISTRRLIEESAAFYEILIGDAYQSVADSKKREQIIGGFLLAELLDIWTMPYSLRGNYHMRLEEWEGIIVQAGFASFRYEKAFLGAGGVECLCAIASCT